MASADRPDGARQAAEYLRHLVAGPYRHRWLRDAGRLRSGEINKLAVARVIAAYLWESGEYSDQDQELPSRLKDRVARALGGEVLSPRTLRWFIEAFDMGEEQAAVLWRELSEHVEGRQAGEPSLPSVHGAHSSRLHERRPRQDSPTTPRRGGWRVRSFSALFRLDTTSPELVEDRTIQALYDGLNEIAVSLSLPQRLDQAGSTREIEATAMYGGSIVSRERPSESHFRFVFRLPRRLRLGELHDYGIRFKVPEGQEICPHYVFVPLRPCDLFSLRVRFSRSSIPELVWRLDGTAPRTVDDRQPSRDIVVPDEAGELNLQFSDLEQGYAYGIAWRAT